MAKVNKLKTVQKAKPNKVDGLYTALNENANKSFSKQVSKQKTKKAVSVPDTMKAERKLNKKKKTASSSW